MATHGKPIPTKLKNDAIIEAIFEIRFAAQTIPEVLFGRLTDYGPWKGFEQHRLPAYQIPSVLRQADKNLRYEALFELKESSGQRSVRIGSSVLSYHLKAPYVGWGRFRPELYEAIDGLFARAEGTTIRRLGLRYINALRRDLHGIGSVSDLDLKLAIAGEDLFQGVNVNLQRELSNDTQCTVRIATKEFVAGDLPPGTTVVVDVDVQTKGTSRPKDPVEVKRWVELAHSKEKEQFFGLLKNETIDALTES